MDKIESIYNEVTMSDFIASARTVSSFLSGIASAPINDHIEADLLMTGLVLIPFIESHNSFINRLRTLHGDLESRLKKDPETEGETNTEETSEKSE